MIAIILSLNRRKESSLEDESLPSLSYRYAALKVRGCDPGDRVLRGLHRGRHQPDGLLPSIRVKLISLRMCLPRKEVIQPHLPVRLPCYDFTPLTLHTFGASPLDGWAGDFGCRRLGWCDGRCVQDPGTYSPRHADPRLLATPASRRRVAACDPNWDRF